MDEGGLPEALNRAERALARIESAIRDRPQAPGDEELRASVRQVIAELDQLIGEASG